MHATRIIAIRHGETAWNADTRIQGHADIPLNDTGRWQADRLARALADEPIHAVYSSDLSRALETACAIARTHPDLTGRPPRQVQALRERCFGMFEGKTWAEIDANWPDLAVRWRQRDPAFAPEGGETLLQLKERIRQATHAIASRHAGEQIVLVAHGGVLDALYRLATGQDLASPRTWTLGNTAINRLLWTPDGLTLVGWSDSRHLEGGALDEVTA